MEKKVKDRIDKTIESHVLSRAYSDIHDLFKDEELNNISYGYTVIDNITNEVCNYQISVIKLPKQPTK